jgi:hypothetical protein
VFVTVQSYEDLLRLEKSKWDIKNHCVGKVVIIFAKKQEENKTLF